MDGVSERPRTGWALLLFTHFDEHGWPVSPKDNHHRNGRALRRRQLWRTTRRVIVARPAFLLGEDLLARLGTPFRVDILDRPKVSNDVTRR